MTMLVGFAALLVMLLVLHGIGNLAEYLFSGNTLPAPVSMAAGAVVLLLLGFVAGVSYVIGFVILG